MCVPIIISISPLFNSFKIRFSELFFINLLNTSILTGKFLNLFLNVLKCCSARIVVGESTITCLFPITALNAALIATSVFPNPTSPQRRRSITLKLIMSSLISFIAVI
ncbi:hypothetical protein BafHLJ01_0686 [Borreliella afzelii HLJ01]|nr:hypothetical protein BafHLJ01_0686 [Borreliella afzelii HLJ01]